MKGNDGPSNHLGGEYALLPVNVHNLPAKAVGRRTYGAKDRRERQMLNAGDLSLKNLCDTVHEDVMLHVMATEDALGIVAGAGAGAGVNPGLVLIHCLSSV
jgi:hypothetical protein